MKEYTLSFADSLVHIPEFPDRTATIYLTVDVKYVVFPSRKALCKRIRKQEKLPGDRYNLRPKIALEDGEGYD